MEEIAAPLVAPGIRRLTVNIDHEDLDLFEGLWPIAQGIALHAYLVEGERLVVIDPWDAGGYGLEELQADLEALGRGWSDVAAVAFTKPPTGDLVSRLHQAYPTVAVWGTPTPGARHDLGAGVVLQERGGFWIQAPSGVAFTGDHFAGLGWVEDELWTEDLGEHEARYFEDEALRWFAARPFAVPALPEGTRVVAPAHGCLWKNPEGAVTRATQFADWAHDGGLDEVTIVWPADDEAGCDALVGGALDAGVGLNLYRVPGDDATALAAGARRAGLVVAAPGLDRGFLHGLDKDVWFPEPHLSPDDLRRSLVERWRALSEQS